MSAAPRRTDVIARLRALSARAAAAVKALDLPLAADLYDAAHVLGSAADQTEIAAECLAGLGHVAHLQSDVRVARERYEHALPGIVDAERRALVRGRIAFALYDDGDLGGARRELEALVDGATDTIRARATGYLGNVARAQRNLDHARSLYSDAIRALTELGDGEFVATFTMDSAICSLLAGDAVSALAELQMLRERQPFAGRPYLAMLVAHYEALARAELGLSADPDASVEIGLPWTRHLAGVRRMATASVVTDDALVELRETAPANAHARIGLAIVEASRLRRRSPDPSVLVVARGGAFFRLGAADAVVLSERVVLQRIVGALAEARVRAPGTFLEGERIAEIAWPGERMLPSSRKNRLHVAITTLRRLGLRAVLVSRGSGYRIDPDVRTIIVE